MTRPPPASIVQLTANTMRVCSASNFPASVLTRSRRPTAVSTVHREACHIEIGTTAADLANRGLLGGPTPVSIYLSCASEATAERAAVILDVTTWRKLSANRDNQVFVVNDQVWQTGEEFIVAARGIVDDLRWVDAPIASVC